MIRYLVGEVQFYSHQESNVNPRAKERVLRMNCPHRQYEICQLQYTKKYNQMTHTIFEK